MNNIKNFSFLFSGLTAVSGLAAANKTSKPNILVILCDDLGYNDVGFNGSNDISTPNLDALARDGVIFSSAYVAHPFSGPSRAALMTGRYPQNIGTPYNLRDEGLKTESGVPVNETFISNVLHDAGYYTAAIGKWHLGEASQFQPNKRGFDEFYGFLGGGHKYFPNQFQPAYEKQIKADKYPISGYLLPILHNDKPVELTDYLTDVFSNQGVEVIKKSSDLNKPFFLYLAYNAPHVPLEAKAEDKEKFSNIKDENRRTYAAMVYAVDRGVGEIVKTLKEKGEYDNTLIVFLSDNGGNTDHGANNDPLKGTKGDTWEGGFRTPMFFHWPAVLKSGQRFNDPVSSLDLYPTFVQIANAKIPVSKKLDGKDILNDVIAGQSQDKNRMIFSLRYREGYCDVAARQGDWKITRMGNEPWGLYNITKDISEHRDLGGQFPDRLKSMVEATQKWTLTHVKPLWVYSAEDEELWNDGTFPGYNKTFEVEKLILPPSTYQIKK
ncbi:MAG: sulfatase-like hydrolase/transferase [Bacteroidales bacterium]